MPIASGIHKSFYTLLTVLFTAAILAAHNAHAAIDLASDLPSGQPVGTTIVWTVLNDTPDAYDYRLSVVAPASPARIVYDYSARRVFQWTPMQDGEYEIIVSARDRANAGVTHVPVTFAARSRVTDRPIVSATDHPLVALYSAPPCPIGQRMRVHFVTFEPKKFFATDFKNCDGVRSVNVYLAGLLADKIYFVRHELQALGGLPVATGPLLAHATGNLPTDLVTLTPVPPASVTTSTVEGVILSTPLSILGDQRPQVPVATDLAGRVLWYYDREPETNPQLWRPNKGGTFLVGFDIDGKKWQGLREIDLAGHVVRETTALRLSEQLLFAGYEPITAIHHEARRLPNGDTAVLGSVERIIPDAQGTQGLVDILGDAVVVLDKNWQVAWYWNAFDHLAVNRAAVIGEVCGNTPPNDAGCPHIVLVDGVNTFANDWLHSNSIDYSPADGNLVISMRHQDWVIKIAYENGAGTGEVLWRLGPDGDFALDAGNTPTPWFSHQHDAQFIDATRLVLYDNGNTRCEAEPIGCMSRGQVYEIDELTGTARLLVNASLGVFASALGSAQGLSNGNLYFHSGLKTEDGANIPISKVAEIRPSGLRSYVAQLDAAAYRSFRLVDLYRGSMDAPQ